LNNTVYPGDEKFITCNGLQRRSMTCLYLSRQGQHVGRKYTPHTLHPSRPGRNVGFRRHIPSRRDGTPGGGPVSTNILSLTGHRKYGYMLFILHSLINNSLKSMTYE
jgi:hypothetical protein